MRYFCIATTWWSEIWRRNLIWRWMVTVLYWVFKHVQTIKRMGINSKDYYWLMMIMAAWWYNGKYKHIVQWTILEWYHSQLSSYRCFASLSWLSIYLSLSYAVCHSWLIQFTARNFWFLDVSLVALVNQDSHHLSKPHLWFVSLKKKSFPHWKEEKIQVLVLSTSGHNIEQQSVVFVCFCCNHTNCWSYLRW